MGGMKGRVWGRWGWGKAVLSFGVAGRRRFNIRFGDSNECAGATNGHAGDSAVSEFRVERMSQTWLTNN